MQREAQPASAATPTSLPPGSARRTPAWLRWPFWLKLTLSSSLLVTVPFFLLLPFVQRELEEHLKRLHREVQLLVALDLTHDLDDATGPVEDGLHMLAQTLLDPKLSVDQAEALSRHLLSGLAAMNQAAIYLEDGQLDVVLREDAALPYPFPEILPENLRSAATNQEPTLGSLRKLAVGGTPDRAGYTALLAVQVRGPTGAKAFLAAPASFHTLQQAVVEAGAAHLPGADSRILVMDRKLRVLADSAGSLTPIPTEAADHPVIRGSPFRNGATSNALRHVPVLVTEYANPDPMIGSLVPSDDGRWLVALETPQSSAYQAIRRVTQSFYSAAAIALLASLLLALLFAKHLSRPVQQLIAFSKKLARREFGHRVRVWTRDEFFDLGEAMNQAARDLRSSEELLLHEAEVRRDLARYLPGELVDRVLAREQEMHLGGDIHQVTILFADVVGFTPITQRLEPEKVVALLNELFTLLTEVVFRHRGTVDKFVGDSLMAMWGAPMPQTDHAERALRAAEDMQRFVRAANPGLRERYGVEVELATGVHSGSAVVGNIGSTSRMEYTAIGDTVNIAARLESIARPSQILISGATKEALPNPDAFAFREVGTRQLAGTSAPISLYEVAE